MLKYISRNILFFFTLFLLAFIPLYPKLPLIGVTHTWVYIRLDDFLIAVAVFIYGVQLLRQKVSLKTPLTTPILLFWITGLLSTVLAILFIFPHLEGVFPKIAFLYYLRHIEYLSVFFIAYSSIKEKKQIAYVILVTIVTITLVTLYGFGQRFFPIYFPAFSTMNEEFAKGFVLILNATDRLQSTFAGHYDLAAYLVFVLPIIGSLVFGLKKWWMKIVLILLGIAALLILLMTASRTSFAVYLAGMTLMLILQRQKRWIVPVILVSLFMLYSFSGLYYRYASTVKPVKLAYDTQGKILGIAKETSDGKIEIDKTQIPSSDLPASTLPVGDSKVVATASGVTIKEKTANNQKTTEKKVQGKVIIQETQTLDISIATRLQAEWPNAIQAFLRDPIFGSGYSSIGLATDGNYFRILAETGVLGLAAFLSIFFYYTKYIYDAFHYVTDNKAQAFLLGIFAGVFGLTLNAVLIDVFEASKIAYTLWIFIGISLSILHLYKKEHK